MKYFGMGAIVKVKFEWLCKVIPLSTVRTCVCKCVSLVSVTLFCLSFPPEGLTEQVQSIEEQPTALKKWNYLKIQMGSFSSQLLAAYC